MTLGTATARERTRAARASKRTLLLRSPCLRAGLGSACLRARFQAFFLLKDADQIRYYALYALPPRMRGSTVDDRVKEFRV